MASKSSGTTRRSTHETEQHTLPAQSHEQMADMTEKAATLFREVEAVQQINQHSAQRTALKLQQAAEQLRSSTGMTELFSIQSTLMLGSMQEMAQYMQEMTVTLMRMQMALVPRQHSARGQEAGAASGAEAPAGHSLASAPTAAEAASAATAAMLQSWSNMMGAGLSSSDGRAAH